MRTRIEQHGGVVDVPVLVAVYTGPQQALVSGTVALRADLAAVAARRTGYDHDMPRPEHDPDEHDAQYDDHPRAEVTRNGNPGVPQSEYVQSDITPPPGPAEQEGDHLSVGPEESGH